MITSPSGFDGTSADLESSGGLIRKELWLGPVIRLGSSVRAPTPKAGDPRSNPGPGEHFFLN